MCGTPFPADALGGVVPMELRYGLEDRYLSKSNGLEEEPGTEAEREHRIGGFVLWRATNRLALLGRLPYNVKSIEETPEGGPTTTRTQHGLGDAEATALVGLVHTEGRHGAVLGMVLGASAPTGSNVERDNTGERLDEHLQPRHRRLVGHGGVELRDPDRRRHRGCERDGPPERHERARLPLRQHAALQRRLGEPVPARRAAARSAERPYRRPR
jgi:hypothetical protein